VLVIKAQQHRSLERNREEAIARLHELVERAAHVPKARRATRPSRASKARRLEGKQRRGEVKRLRGRVGATD
jgi:ribosome-associated protein